MMLQTARDEVERLKVDKAKTVEYFVHKRALDVQSWQDKTLSFHQKLQQLKSNFNNHGPFTLSWKSEEALHELDSIQEQVGIVP